MKNFTIAIVLGAAVIPAAAELSPAAKTVIAQAAAMNPKVSAAEAKKLSNQCIDPIDREVRNKCAQAAEESMKLWMAEYLKGQ